MRRYRPGFLVRLRRRDEDVQRYLILEVSGGRKDQGARQIKADTASNLWCVAANNGGRFGRWGYLEVDDPLHIRAALDDAIRYMYADKPTTRIDLDPFAHPYGRPRPTEEGERVRRPARQHGLPASTRRRQYVQPPGRTTPVDYGDESRRRPDGRLPGGMGRDTPRWHRYIGSGNGTRSGQHRR